MEYIVEIKRKGKCGCSNYSYRIIEASSKASAKRYFTGMGKTVKNVWTTEEVEMLANKDYIFSKAI